MLALHPFYSDNCAAIFAGIVSVSFKLFDALVHQLEELESLFSVFKILSVLDAALHVICRECSPYRKNWA